MPQNTMDRRGVLKAAAGIAGAAAAATVAATLPAAAHTRPRTAFPDVPGMVGDRRANEFWYEYDERFYFNPTPELVEAVDTITQPFGGFTKVDIGWAATRSGGRYPRSFLELVAPSRDAFVLLSDAQRDVYREFYGNDPHGLVRAFQDFGQGVLFDPRRSEGNKVHMMNFTPPDFTHAYHRWHPFLAAFRLLDIDVKWWTHINRLAGTAWELQALAQPAIDANDNKRLPGRTVRAVTTKWLHRTPAQLDTAFDTFPYPADMGTR
ncbi:Tat pathway signal sequence domain protein [Streptomyces sp. NPDC056347]|uniref:Tat pathway signal sequence domain protein n=1 Tax=Streptomyces sp. NPDC056347 TaxID=3345790 RepID=UPI0035D7BDEC